MFVSLFHLSQSTDGTLLLYTLSVHDPPKGVFNQIDPPSKNLCRDSAELFLKETIPSLTLTLVRHTYNYI